MDENNSADITKRTTASQVKRETSWRRQNDQKNHKLTDKTEVNQSFTSKRSDNQRELSENSTKSKLPSVIGKTGSPKTKNFAESDAHWPKLGKSDGGGIRNAPRNKQKKPESTEKKNEKDTNDETLSSPKAKSMPQKRQPSTTTALIPTSNGGIILAQSCSKCQYSPAYRNRRYGPIFRSVKPLVAVSVEKMKDDDKCMPEKQKNVVLEDSIKMIPFSIPLPTKRIISSSLISGVMTDRKDLTLFKKFGAEPMCLPLMQCGTLEVPDSYQRSPRMDAFQIDDGFHSDGGTESPPPSPSSSSSIASTSDHGSLESVDTGGAQRLAVLSFEQVRKLNDVMDETVAIHGRGNFPTLEVKLKDLVTMVRKKLESDVASGGAGMVVKDIRLNGGAGCHVLASEAQPYNDLDLIFALEFSSNRHFDRVKTAVLNTLLDLLPEGVSRRRIMPCSLKEAYVGKMVKVNNNNDGDRWSLISLGNSPGHKNVELKFVDTMRRQFEFSVDSFQIVLDSLLLFYDCAALPISENFYPTVVGESVYGDFQEALYHLQKKLISTRQPEEIRGGGLLKYCNLLVRNYQPVDPEKIKTLERYMCSRFFIDFPDISTQTVKLEGYLRNHFWGVDEEPLQYQYLMHLREVVETSTVCLMGHERRQTLLLIQSLAMQVLCREQQKQHQQQQQHQHQQAQAAHQQQHHQHQQHQQHTHQHQSAQIAVMHQQHQQQQQSHQQQQATTMQTVQVQQLQPQATTTVQAIALTTQPQTQQQQNSNTTQTIQLQAPPGLLYANGVYYAPVIPTTICTCNSTWLST